MSSIQAKKGTIIARNYRIEEEIGRGKISVSVKVREKGNPEIKAMKIFDCKNISAKRKLYQEEQLNLFQQIDHPNLLKIYNVVKTDQQVYVITKLAQYNNIRDYLETKPKKFLEESEAIHFLKQIMIGFSFLTRHKIVHKNIKPENVLVTTGAVYLADYGFSTCRFWNGQWGEGRGYTCGVSQLIYTAPEVFSNEEGTKPEVSDIWSIGLIAYFMLYGVHYFENVKNKAFTFDEFNKAQQKLSGTNLEFHNKIRRVSNEFKDLLARMIEPEPTRRITIQGIFRHKLFDKPMEPGGIMSEILPSILSNNEVEKNFKEEKEAVERGKAPSKPLGVVEIKFEEPKQPDESPFKFREVNWTYDPSQGNLFENQFKFEYSPTANEEENREEEKREINPKMGYNTHPKYQDTMEKETYGNSSKGGYVGKDYATPNPANEPKMGHATPSGDEKDNYHQDRKGSDREREQKRMREEEEQRRKQKEEDEKRRQREEDEKRRQREEDEKRRQREEDEKRRRREEDEKRRQREEDEKRRQREEEQRRKQKEEDEKRRQKEEQEEFLKKQRKEQEEFQRKQREEEDLKRRQREQEEQRKKGNYDNRNNLEYEREQKKELQRKQKEEEDFLRNQRKDQEEFQRKQREEEDLKRRQREQEEQRKKKRDEQNRNQVKYPSSNHVWDRNEYDHSENEYSEYSNISKNIPQKFKTNQNQMNYRKPESPKAHNEEVDYAKQMREMMENTSSHPNPASQYNHNEGSWPRESDSSSHYDQRSAYGMESHNFRAENRKPEENRRGMEPMSSFESPSYPSNKQGQYLAPQPSNRGNRYDASQSSSNQSYEGSYGQHGQVSSNSYFDSEMESEDLLFCREFYFFKLRGIEFLTILVGTFIRVAQSRDYYSYRSRLLEASIYVSKKAFLLNRELNDSIDTRTDVYRLGRGFSEFCSSESQRHNIKRRREEVTFSVSQASKQVSRVLGAYYPAHGDVNLEQVFYFCMTLEEVGMINMDMLPQILSFFSNTAPYDESIIHGKDEALKISLMLFYALQFENHFRFERNNKFDWERFIAEISTETNFEREKKAERLKISEWAF